MATKTPKTLKATKQLPKADDLEVLHPNVTLTIDKKTITVREYNFIEGLRVRAATKPFIDELYGIFEQSTLDVDAYLHLIAVHIDLLLPHIAIAADVEPDFLDTLNTRDGEQLLSAWWIANGPFFLRALSERRAIASLNRATNHAGQTSTPS